MRQVPTLDIRRYDTDRAAFVAELGAAYRQFGFCCIRGHGIARELWSPPSPIKTSSGA